MEKTKWFLDILNEDGTLVKSVIIDELLSEVEMTKKAKHILSSYPWKLMANLEFSLARFT